VREFVLGLGDMPRFTVTKTLHSDALCGRGLGLHHTATRHGQRVLDATDRMLEYTLQHSPEAPPSSLIHHLLDVKARTARHHGAFMDPSLPRLPVQASHPLSGCVISELTPGPQREATY
jgi:hypothetical protein